MAGSLISTASSQNGGRIQRARSLMRSPIASPSNILVCIVCPFAIIGVDIFIEYTIDDGKGNKVHVNV